MTSESLHKIKIFPGVNGKKRENFFKYIRRVHQ